MTGLPLPLATGRRAAAYRRPHARIGALELPSPVLAPLDQGARAPGDAKSTSSSTSPSSARSSPSRATMLARRAACPTPRCRRRRAGMLGTIPLQGPGIDAFVDNGPGLARFLAARGRRVGRRRDRRGVPTRLAQRLRNPTASASVEVNISCPSVESRGQVFACDPVRGGGSLRRAAGGHPGVATFVKRPPDATDISAVAHSVTAGADALARLHATLGRSLTPTPCDGPALAGRRAGCGPAIRPWLVRCVHQVHVRSPDRGMGGSVLARTPSSSSSPGRARSRRGPCSSRTRPPRPGSSGESSPSRGRRRVRPARRRHRVCPTAPGPEWPGRRRRTQLPDDEDSDDFGPDVRLRNERRGAGVRRRPAATGGVTEG